MLEREAPNPMLLEIDLPRIGSPGPTRRRPIVAVLSLAALLLYGWGLTRGAPHFLYSAAVRSMSLNWHNFVYGAADPAGTLTIDKLPGWLWVHAALVRVFGMHNWVLLLPEMLAAAAAVPLLHGAVRRWTGERAALLAVLAFLLTPVTFRAAQMNIPDTMLMFCVVAAAYAMVRAWQRPAWAPLLASAVLLGVAFQMKMIPALVAGPAMAAAYLVGSRLPGWARTVRVAVFAVTALVVSASWMVFFSLVPAGSRPAVDGSRSNSIWEMVFIYNGTGRADATHAALYAGEPGVGRLFNDQIGTQISWLLPLAVLLLVVGLVRALTATPRDAGRTAGWVLWGGWLVLVGVAFSMLRAAHPYYTTLLTPALAAVTGGGLDAALTAWRERRPVAWLLPAGVLASSGWAMVLLLREPVGLGWLAVPVAVAGCAAVVLLLLARRDGAGPTAGLTALAAVAVAVLAAPAGWLLSTPRLAPDSLLTIDPVAGPAALQAAREKAVGPVRPPHVDARLVSYLSAHHGGERFLFAAGEFGTAAPYILAGYDVLPLRGFSPQSPVQPLNRLESLVAAGQLRYLLLINQPETMPSREIGAWLKSSCKALPRAAYAAPDAHPSPWDPTLFDCRP